MISKYKYKNVTWVDISKPTRNEILEVTEEYQVPKGVAEELLTETLKSKVDYYEKDELIYLVLHFPFYDSKEMVVVEKEIDFIIGNNFLITTHYHSIEAFTQFPRMFDDESLLDANNIGQNSGFLFFYILKQLYKYLDSDLDGIAVNLEKIEHDIFEGRERDAVNSISYTNRKIIKIRKAIGFHGDMIKSIESAGTNIFGSNFSFNMSIILSEYNKVNATAAWYKEVLVDMRDTNNTLLTTKTNETIQVLTIMTFIMLPMTLITGVFGMNVMEDVILIQTKSDFLLVLGLMGILGIMMYLYFKGKKWL